MVKSALIVEMRWIISFVALIMSIVNSTFIREMNNIMNIMRINID